MSSIFFSFNYISQILTNTVEDTIGQVQEVGSSVFDVLSKVFGAVSEAVNPGVDAALPILQQAGDQAGKYAFPTISEASKKAQEAIMQSSGFDMETAAKADHCSDYSIINC
ncbi:calcium sensing receptor, chloroplastic-like isoform X2 [Apium graveolens]|uniref:calcium sensing receptor, chloroplastic-like isoform X2 n=1 Tax=Apium graveolens TaxID=4045 RepID=UPI003D79606E